MQPLPLGFESESLFTKREIERYAAHIMLRELGISGHEALKQLRVVVVGIGGLGCTCLSFLCAQGYKEIGIVDGDVISFSNLTRQILYSSHHVGELKVASAKRRCAEINPNVAIQAYPEFLNSGNAKRILTHYDIVCDCTDNLSARLIVSDWCVLLDKPLVSAAALKWQGHITVYNYASTSREGKPDYWGNRSGCFRCLYGSTQLASDSSQNCGEIGVIGGIVGILGSLQAIEVLKIATKMKKFVLAGRMLYYDALRGIPRVFTLFPRRSSCGLCGSGGIAEKIWRMKSSSGLAEDAQKILTTEMNFKSCIVSEGIALISVIALFNQLYTYNRPCILLDVRSANERSMCRLPLLKEKFKTKFVHVGIPLDEVSDNIEFLLSQTKSTFPVYIICRKGIRSSEAAKKLRSEFNFPNVFSVAGGLRAWRAEVDSSFPEY